MEVPVLIHPYWRYHSNKSEHSQDATSDHLPHLCTVSDCFLILLNVSSLKITDHSPIKKLFHKLENSIQTYINYHKTHAMATHYSGMEDTSMENPESQDIDSDSQQNYQEEHIVLLQHLTHEMEQLRQTVEDKNNDPRDAITHLEQNCNQLAITLHPHRTTGEVLNKYTDTLCNAQKKTSLESSLLQDIPTLNGNDSSQLEDWLTDIETA